MMVVSMDSALSRLYPSSIDSSNQSLSLPLTVRPVISGGDECFHKMLHSLFPSLLLSSLHSLHASYHSLSSICISPFHSLIGDENDCFNGWSYIPPSFPPFHQVPPPPFLSSFPLPYPLTIPFYLTCWWCRWLF